MKPDLFSPPPEGCDSFQAQLSDLADAGGALTPELRTHLATCEACARFAETWLPGPPAGLARLVATAPDVALRERILDAVPPANVVRFPAATDRHGAAWTTWLGRIVASVAVAGMAYWLLNPMASTTKPRSNLASSTTLSQGFLQLEDQTKREQQTLEKAFVEGGSQVRGHVIWTMSALEL